MISLVNLWPHLASLEHHDSSLTTNLTNSRLVSCSVVSFSLKLAQFCLVANHESAFCL